MKNWRLWAGILVTVACLVWLVRGTDLRGLCETLRQTQYVWLVPAFLVYVLGMWVRALRWSLLLQARGLGGVSRLFRLANIGYLVNSVTPLRLGDVLRAYLCAERGGFSLVRVLSTLVVERIGDILALLLILSALLPFVTLPAEYAGPVLAIGLGAVLGALLLAVLAVRGEWSLRQFDRVAQRVPALNTVSLRRLVQSVTEGLGVLATGRSVLAVLGTSVIAWLISGVQFYWVARAVGLRLPWSAPFLMVCLTSLGMVVPASPGSLGVIESITVLTLGLFRVDRETAVGYALVLRALSYVTLAGLGLYSLWQEGLDLAGLRKIAAQPPSGLENTSAG